MYSQFKPVRPVFEIVEIISNFLAAGGSAEVFEGQGRLKILASFLLLPFSRLFLIKLPFLSLHFRRRHSRGFWVFSDIAV